MKNLIIIGLILFSFDVLACPGCAGSMDNPADTNLVYILMGFIGITYIPFYIIYKTIYKHRKKVSEN